MKGTLLLIAYVACGVIQIEAGTFPAELAGVWAPARAKLSGGVLSEGYAIYINTNGFAAVAVAPPPIGAKWFATYEATNRMLSLRIDAQPNEGLARAMTNYFTYNPKAKTLTATNASATEILRYLGGRIPRGVIEDLK